jgi:ureidoglycolate hydrolase
METVRTVGAESATGHARLVIPSGRASADGEEFSYTHLLSPGGLGEPAIMAELTCRPRTPRLEKLERHLATPEVLVALDGEVVVCAAPPGTDPSRCRPGEIQGFLLRQGQGLWMAAGTWHWIPFPTGRQPVCMLLLFREATGDRDLEVVPLSAPLAVGSPR